jgi:hypothetical protein
MGGYTNAVAAAATLALICAHQGGRALPHSKTLAHGLSPYARRNFWTAPVLRRFGRQLNSVRASAMGAGVAATDRDVLCSVEPGGQV